MRPIFSKTPSRNNSVKQVKSTLASLSSALSGCDKKSLSGSINMSVSGANKATLSAFTVTALSALSVTACAQVPSEAQLLNFKHSDIQHSYFDGKENDLLTAGLGVNGLQAAKLSTTSAAAYPDELSLRRAAIYNNYRAIVSTSSDAGYTRLYGPKTSQKPISGHEYRSSVHYKDGSLAANIVVQVPDSFNSKGACIIAAPSSGSRGVWGAIGTAGDWGLRQNCAIAYTDKGTGTGFRFLDNGDHYLGSGILQSAQAHPRKEGELRIATKHAHSGQHIEKDWGRFTLQAVKMAFYLLNQHHKDNDKKYYTRTNTTVIAGSISNGGNSVIQAAELDGERWIDGVVASEPTLNLPQDFHYEVQHKSDSYKGQAKDILNIGIQHALYQPCAILAQKADDKSLFFAATQAAKPALEKRCLNLKNADLLQGEENDLPEQAQKKLNELGFRTPVYSLQAFAVVNQLWPSIAINYANAYGQKSVEDSLCDFSMVYQQAGKASTMPQNERQRLYGNSSGIANTAGIHLAYKKQPLNLFDINDSSFTGLQCLASFYENNQRLQSNIADLALTGDIHNKPAIIIQGSHDSLVGPNHNARAYMALHANRHPKRDNIRYLEINYGQHFDALLSWPEFRQQLVPMHYYFEQAMDAMWQHLKHQTMLPSHQQIMSHGALKMESKQLPAISTGPAITINSNKVVF